jgi:hypothetical protein
LIRAFAAGKLMAARDPALPAADMPLPRNDF